MDLVCLSHSPLMRHIEPRDERGRRFRAGAERARHWISERRPDVIVAFAPDHFNGFRWDVMPSFCIGYAAEATRDWEVPPGTLDVPLDLARDLAKAIRDAEIDIAVSRRLRVDHGFTIPLYMLAGSLDAV